MCQCIDGWSAISHRVCLLGCSIDGQRVSIPWASWEARLVLGSLVKTMMDRMARFVLACCCCYHYCYYYCYYCCYCHTHTHTFTLAP